MTLSGLFQLPLVPLQDFAFSGSVALFLFPLTYPSYLPFFFYKTLFCSAHQSKPDFTASTLNNRSSRTLLLAPVPSVLGPGATDRPPTFPSQPSCSTAHLPRLSRSLAPGCHMRNTKSGQRLGYCACAPVKQREEQPDDTSRDKSSRGQEMCDSTVHAPI